MTSKCPAGDHPGLFYHLYQAKVLFESSVIVMGWNYAQQFHNMANSKPAAKPGQPYTTDTVNTQSGDGVYSIIYLVDKNSI